MGSQPESFLVIAELCLKVAGDWLVAVKLARLAKNSPVRRWGMREFDGGRESRREIQAGMACAFDC